MQRDSKRRAIHCSERAVWHEWLAHTRVHQISAAVARGRRKQEQAVAFTRWMFVARLKVGPELLEFIVLYS